MSQSQLFSEAEDQISTAIILLISAYNKYNEGEELPHHHDLTAEETAIRKRLFQIEAALSFINPEEPEANKAKIGISYKGIESGTR